jgi:hypothetical protein
LAPSRRRSATLVRSIRLGVLGSWRFRCEDSAMRVGFPWILSSESRLFNGLRSLKRGIFFSALFRGVTSAGKGARGRGHAEAQDCSWRKLNSVSDFLQEIVVRAVPFGRLNPKAARSGEWSLRRSRTKCSRCVRPIVSTISINFAPFDRVQDRARRGRWAPAVNKARIGRRAGRDRRRRRGGRLHAGVREILLRHEGWRPSACQDSKSDRVVSSERISAGRHSFPGDVEILHRASAGSSLSWQTPEEGRAAATPQPRWSISPILSIPIRQSAYRSEDVVVTDGGDVLEMDAYVLD